MGEEGAEAGDRRVVRRALTEAELERLLRIARLRPLAEYGRETVKLPPEKREGRRTWSKAPLRLHNIEAAAERARAVFAERPERLAELDLTGRERALVYKSAVLTGLRRGELASLTVADAMLGSPHPHLILRSVAAKSARGVKIALRADLVGDLRRCPLTPSATRAPGSRPSAILRMILRRPLPQGATR